MLDMEFLKKEVGALQKDASKARQQQNYFEAKAREQEQIYNNKNTLAKNLYYMDIYDKKEHALKAVQWNLQKYNVNRYGEQPFTMYIYTVHMALNYKHDFSNIKVKIVERPQNKLKKWSVEVRTGEQVGNYVYFSDFEGVQVATIDGLFKNKLFTELKDAEIYAVNMIDKLNFFIRGTKLYLQYIQTVGTGIDELDKIPTLKDAKEVR